ncbi:MAG: pentapeptide repeat-containing protein [Pseudomonadales bacterium]|nr:pentapeptide repeat-containing protein [Pseudomonadales bacterium]
MSDKPRRGSSSGNLILGFVLGSLAASPFIFVSVNDSLDNIRQTFFSAFYIIVGLSFGLLIFKLLLPLIIRKIFKSSPAESLAQAAEEARLFTSTLSTGEVSKATEHAIAIIREFLSVHGWLTVRNWAIGVVLAMLATYAGLAGTFLLLEQNKLLENQNEVLEAQKTLLGNQNDKFEDQNTLIESQLDYLAKQNTRLQEQLIIMESQRRSSLIIEITAILDDVSDLAKANRERRTQELKASGINPKAKLIVPEKLERNPELLSCYRVRSYDILKLQRYLSGRIIALSRSLRPYAYLNNQLEITKNLRSPERTQLVIALSSAGVSMDDLKEGDFSFLDMENARFPNSLLYMLTITNSSFQSSNLTNGCFAEAVLDHSYFNAANANFSYFGKASLNSVKFLGTQLYLTNFRSAHLDDTRFNGANLKHANFSDAILKKVDFSSANLTNVNFESEDADTEMSDITLDQANISCANFGSLRLGQDILNKACVDVGRNGPLYPQGDAGPEAFRNIPICKETALESNAQATCETLEAERESLLKR